MDVNVNVTDAPTASMVTDAPTLPPVSAPLPAPVEDEQNENTCNICPGGVSNPDGIIAMPGSNSGSSEISCSELESAGMAGSIFGDELCNAVQKEAAAPCCGVIVVEEEEEEPAAEVEVEEEKPQESADDAGEDDTSFTNEDYCNPCGTGKVSTNDDNDVSVPTQGIFTCKELIDLGKDGTLDDNGICALVQSSAQTPCGCVADGPTTAPTNASPTTATTETEDSLAEAGGAAIVNSSYAMIYLVAVVATTTVMISSSLNLSW